MLPSAVGALESSATNESLLALEDAKVPLNDLAECEGSFGQA